MTVSLAPFSPAQQRVRELRATGSLVFNAFLWGSMIAFTGELLHAYDPFIIAAARYAIAGPTLLLLAAWRERATPMPGRLPMGRIMILGGVGMTGFATCYTYGIRWSDPITAAAILAMNPIVSLITQWLLDGVRTPVRMFPGIALATGGAVIVALGRSGGAGGGAHGGEMLLILGGMMWAWYSLRAQSWLAGPGGLSQLRLSAVTTSAGGFWLVVVMCVSVALGDTHLPTEWPTPVHAGQLLWLGILSTAAAIAIWNAAVSVLGVGVASLFTNLAPVFAVLISVGLGAEPTIWQLVGGCVVIAGVVWVQLVKLRTTRPT